MEQLFACVLAVMHMIHVKRYRVLCKVRHRSQVLYLNAILTATF